MTARDDHHRRLERLTDRALHELPSRRAPASLEGRVLREIAQRADRPWWRRHFAAWPLAARAALIASCGGSAAVVLLGSPRLAARLAAFGTQPFIAHQVAGLRAVAEAIGSLTRLVQYLTHSIPSAWLMGGLIATALLYVLLFALIAIAYRLLYATPEPSGARPI
jgi:hypothetical protein